MLGSFTKTYVATLLLLAFVALVIVLVSLGRSIWAQIQPEFRPIGATLDSYSLEYTVLGGGPIHLEIDLDGRACEALRASERLRVACILTLNENPRIIAGEAFGRLNTEDTPSFEAIKWRAHLESDPSFCNDSGLLAPRLDECRVAAGNGDYEVEDSGISVVITARPSAP